jgi:hypothetical protein
VAIAIARQTSKFAWPSVGETRSVFQSAEEALVALNATVHRYAELVAAPSEPSLEDVGLLSVLAASLRIQLDTMESSVAQLERFSHNVSLEWEGPVESR